MKSAKVLCIAAIGLLVALATPVSLATLGGNYGSAAWINDAGEIAGWAYTKTQAPHAVLWKRGGKAYKAHDLGVLGLKSGVKIDGFVRIGRKLRICTEIYAAVDQSFMELASGLQRFQLVNSMQDFLSPHHYKGRVG